MAIFGSTIAKQFGFSTSAVGLIFFFVPLGSLFCRVILGMVADKYHLLKTIKTVCLMTCAVTVLLLSFLPKRGDASVPTTVWCGQNETTVENRQFDEAFCQSAQKAQTDVCEVRYDIYSFLFDEVLLFRYLRMVCIRVKKVIVCK